MTHRGKRSAQSLQRKFILSVSYFDKRSREIISLANHDYTVTASQEKYPYHTFTYTDSTEPGEVLVDTRGQGTFQRR